MAVPFHAIPCMPPGSVADLPSIGIGTADLLASWLQKLTALWSCAWLCLALPGCAWLCILVLRGLGGWSSLSESTDNGCWRENRRSCCQRYTCSRLVQAFSATFSERGCANFESVAEACAGERVVPALARSIPDGAAASTSNSEKHHLFVQFVHMCYASYSCYMCYMCYMCFVWYFHYHIHQSP